MAGAGGAAGSETAAESRCARLSACSKRYQVMTPATAMPAIASNTTANTVSNGTGLDGFLPASGEEVAGGAVAGFVAWLGGWLTEIDAGPSVSSETATAADGAGGCFAPAPALTLIVARSCATSSPV